MNTEQFDGHTPGPWRAVLDDTDGHMCVVIAEGDEKREAQLHLPCWVCEQDMLELTAAAELIAAAPDLLEEVKRLREVIDKEHPTFDWASRQTIANLEAEVKRLRRLNNYLWEHRSSHWSADDDAEMDRLEMIE